MPNSTTEPEDDTILRNLGLITTSGNCLIYIVAPIACLVLSFYIISRPTSSFLTVYQQGFLAVCLVPFVTLCLAFWRADIIKEQLKKDGYVQRRTRERELDLAISFAPVLAFLYYAQKYEGDGKESKLAVAAMGIGGVLLFWWMIVLISLGPILWFTVRDR